MAELKVTLTRGRAGKRKEALTTLTSLGLTRSGRTVLVQDNPATRGMIDKVKHLVTVERLED